MSDAQAGAGSTEKRPRNKHIREKIRVANLLERLERNAMGELDPPMTSQQIKSAEIALKKAIPDLQAITISGDDEAAPVSVVTKIERCVVRSQN